MSKIVVVPPATAAWSAQSCAQCAAPVCLRLLRQRAGESTWAAVRANKQTNGRAKDALKHVGVFLHGMEGLSQQARRTSWEPSRPTIEYTNHCSPRAMGHALAPWPKWHMPATAPHLLGHHEQVAGGLGWQV